MRLKLIPARGGELCGHALAAVEFRLLMPEIALAAHRHGVADSTLDSAVWYLSRGRLQPAFLPERVRSEVGGL